MSLQKIKQQGFTIVELLIVVVVIGILAAIVVVAYNGVTNSAKSSNARSTGSSIAKKFEAYNAVNSSYPATYSVMDDTSTSSWYIPTGTYNILATTGSLSNSSNENDFRLFSCATGNGRRIETRDFANSTNFVFIVGTCTGTLTPIGT